MEEQTRTPVFSPLSLVHCCLDAHIKSDAQFNNKEKENGCFIHSRRAKQRTQTVNHQPSLLTRRKDSKSPLVDRARCQEKKIPTNLGLILLLIRTTFHKNRHINQWNRKESPEINPCFYGQLINDKPRIYRRKNSLFHKQCWKNQTATCKNNQTILLLSYTIYKNKFKMDWRPKFNTWNHKTSRKKYKQHILWHQF